MLSSTIFIAVLREGERGEKRGGEKERRLIVSEANSMLFLSCFYQELTKHNQQLFL